MTDQISACFANPPAEFSPIPFWWWSGTDLNPAQLKWQLDQLSAKGVNGAVIGYSHFPDAQLDQAHPALWSDEWWAVLLEVLEHARSKGMILGMQDYIVLNAALVTQGPPGRTLHHYCENVPGHMDASVEIPEGGTLVEAVACNGLSTIPLDADHDRGTIVWTPPSDGWTIHVVFTRPMPFDPLAQDSGIRSLELFQEKVAKHIGDHLGTTFKVFFQDELDFHGRWPFWSPEVPSLFAKEHGYELSGKLWEMWHGKTPSAVKIRLDFHATLVGLLEERYFKPVKEWHDRNGCLFGHDNAGRGAVGRGRDFYGDYMRTMRWYSAPGSDDPDVRGPRAFIGLKVASSLATLYSRDRVWAECFHSSGWGATPNQLMAATNSAFALGANLINLHGLYASTQGSWWEWAPPDFHFRQPYWACMDAYATYVARLSWLLSQGEKRGDVAILYPTMALVGGINAKVSPEAGTTAYSEQQRGEALPPLDPAELDAFRLAQALFDDGVDVDFIDDESIEKALIFEGKLRAGKGEWHTIVLTQMSAIRLETLRRLLDFREAGGRVVLIGATPTATNSCKIDDNSLASLVSELANERLDEFGELSLERIVPRHTRSQRAAKLQTIRRRIDKDDLYFLHNPAKEPFRGEVILAGNGTVTRLDPETGKEGSCPHIALDQSSLRVHLEIDAQRIAVLRVSSKLASLDGHAGTERGATSKTMRTIVLDGPWSYSLLPTMDNRHKDFAGEGAMIGLEINRLKWRETSTNDWVTIAADHAPRYLTLGPVPTSEEFEDWIKKQSFTSVTESLPPFEKDGVRYSWREAFVSAQDGILDDPWLKNWACGPHGLKNQVPDDYIDCGVDLGGYVSAVAGVISATEPEIIVSSQAAYSLWIDGQLVAQQPEPLPAKTIPPWNLPSYDAPSRRVAIEPGKQHRFVLQLSQPHSQRLRAHLGIADAPKPMARCQRFLADHRFSIWPSVTEANRPQLYQLNAPPGPTAFTIRHLGRLSASRDGQPLAVETKVLTEAWYSSRVTGGFPSDTAGPIDLRLDGTGTARAGDAVSRVCIENPHGPIELGDWCQQGLAPFSGGVRYLTSYTLSEAVQKAVLDTGEVGACCIIIVNGKKAGSVLGAPWEVDISELIKVGSNLIEIIVFNTLANHYLENTPSPYAHKEQTRSGLFQFPKLKIF